MLRNDVANEVRNDAMFATHVRRHIICEAYIIGEANIICRRQTSFKNRQVSVETCRFLLLYLIAFFPRGVRFGDDFGDGGGPELFEHHKIFVGALVFPDDGTGGGTRVDAVRHQRFFAVKKTAF